MDKNNQIKSFVFLSRTGCLLPMLIILNLLFGWIFIKPLPWLITEAVLSLIFIFNGYIATHKIISAYSGRRRDVIDIEGEVVKEKRHLK